MNKKLLIAAVSVVAFFNLNAQTSEGNVSESKNEVMIDPIMLVAGPVINLDYERLLNENSGIGLNALIYLGNDKDDEGFSQFSPYYRMYFGKKYAAGFFVEGFVPITTSSYTEYNYNSNGYYYVESSHDKNITTIGIGVGFGGKWITKNNILFELSGGIARRFGNDNASDLTLKGMLGIGYRF